MLTRLGRLHTRHQCMNKTFSESVVTLTFEGLRWLGITGYFFSKKVTLLVKGNFAGKISNSDLYQALAGKFSGKAILHHS